MTHKETVRMVDGAKTAVLFMHGICGTPDHFRELLALEELVPQDWSLYNIVLDGHCKKVEDFGRSSMKKWKTQVQSVFDSLCATHEKVVIVGHSMGTLFSIQLALRRSEKVPFIFLIASPLFVRVRPHAVGYMLRIAFDRVKLSDPVQVAMRHACGMETTNKLWKYTTWLPRMVELLQECSETRKCLPALRVPCIAWQSEKDELVSNRSRKFLVNCGNVQVHNLLHSTHFYYSPEDAELVLRSFQDACKEYR